MADWVATFAIGLISHNQGNSSDREAEANGAIKAFWASFLLLHLGGPDTITAFSLEDSSLWRRHLLSFIFQVGAAIYVFVQIFPSDNSLVMPTMLVFFAGVIKNVERTLALNLSSLPRLRKSLMPVSWPFYDDHQSSELFTELNARGEEHSDEGEAELAESIVVKHAYYFFPKFKVFMGDLMFYRLEREMSRTYFQNVSAIDALRMISVELQFMYEVLHTKALAIHSKWSYIFRFIAFTDLALAFVLFNRLKKHQLPEPDVEITYSLLFGGMALDAIALFMLIFSNWTLAKIKWYKTRSSKLESYLHKLVAATDYLRKPRSTTCKVELGANAMFAALDTPFTFRRWSESISACNLLSKSLNESPRKIYKLGRSWGIVDVSNICSIPLRTAKKIVSCFHQVREICCRPRKIVVIANTEYVSKNPFIRKLWIFIFKEVKRKSMNAETPAEVKKTFEARGDLFLQSTLTVEICGEFLAHVTETNYDNSIICWHLATEIWYNKEKRRAGDEEREFSKILSDYMLYLLLNQNNVVSVVAGVAQMTSVAAMVHLVFHGSRNVEELCEQLYAIPPNTSGWPTAVLEGCQLAQKMEGLGDGKWKVMSGVWVEMLCYAASHIRGEAHVQVLSKGGELLAFVWLLMAHFGCFYKPGWGIHRIREHRRLRWY
ncbi:uncharacterized protein LOC115739246 [Rhodamnia argentea]|uniref:Uncharacterized protein LOC115739246 n=1 Tax=Rhodamnia argentea TaxID=178133 RepID=A0A8B8P007_9MYRT|nr:uncharacterized protein LOC115739246 [Rhodamnia argentea]